MTHKPDFDKLLTQGAATYDSEVGNWWVKRAEDKIHHRAYEKIVKALAPYTNSKQGLLVDYACGTGILLKKVLERYPHLRGIGIDGSRNLLERYLSKYDPKARLIDLTQSWKAKNTLLLPTYLPNFSLPSKKADLIIWCFPNLVPAQEYLDEFNDNGYQKQSWFDQAHKLASFREMDPEDEVDNSSAEDKLDELLTQRVIHKNIASLLKTGGIFLKVEYANCHRSELTRLTRLKEQFMEGTLSKDIKGLTTKPFFKELSCAYHKSNVILDVFEQTNDPSDKEGGFTINLFQKR